jgi:hypothetical protein
MIWLLYILLDAFGNWYLIEKRKTRPIYIALNIFRGVMAILYGAFVLDVQNDFYQILDWIAQVFLLFPFLFNTTLNTLRKLPADYVGAESGWIALKDLAGRK